MGSFVVTETKGGQFRFNLKAGNGEVILTSESYVKKASALNGVESVRKNCGDENRFEVRESSASQPYFVLKAKNGQIIGQSQMYKSERSCSGGIASVQKNAPEATLKDQTS